MGHRTYIYLIIMILFYIVYCATNVVLEEEAMSSSASRNSMEAVKIHLALAK